MTYVVVESCIKCKYMDCIEVCPVEAILPDTEGDVEKWVEMNREYSEKWPNITRKGEPPADADDFTEETGKFDKYFSKEPGEA